MFLRCSWHVSHPFHKENSAVKQRIVRTGPFCELAWAHKPNQSISPSSVQSDLFRGSLGKFREDAKEKEMLLCAGLCQSSEEACLSWLVVWFQSWYLLIRRICFSLEFIIFPFSTYMFVNNIATHLSIGQIHLGNMPDVYAHS
jgi:hypothetical protein